MKDKENQTKNKSINPFFNKYIILGFLFLIWMFFFDTNSYIRHKKLNKEIVELENEANYYANKLNIETVQYDMLKNNPKAREKYVRENYFFKKENEDIFITIIDSTKNNK